MLKIGITGGIGSGKTIVCKVFGQLGIPVYYADEESKKLLASDAVLTDEIKKTFGVHCYTPDGKLNRKRLSEIVFNDNAALQTLNGIVHPVVKKHFLAWVGRYATSPYIIKEAAVLFESGADKDLDFIITVFSGKETRIKRVMKRDAVNRKSVEDRINNQMNDEEKIKRADFVLYNDENTLLLPQIVKLHEKFIAV